MHQTCQAHLEQIPYHILSRSHNYTYRTDQIHTKTTQANQDWRHVLSRSQIIPLHLWERWGTYQGNPNQPKKPWPYAHIEQITPLCLWDRWDAYQGNPRQLKPTRTGCTYWRDHIITQMGQMGRMPRQAKPIRRHTSHHYTCGTDVRQVRSTRTIATSWADHTITPMV